MLSIKNLTKIYKTKGGEDTKALDNVTLDFPETGMIFLLGKSGSGKSTLLNLIGGLDFPTSGEIILKGRSSKDFSQSDFDSYRNTYIGFIFQEYNILNEFNVEQNIALAIELQGKKVTKEAVDSLLEQVDLTGYGKRKPNTLSGGQKQRIAIARALIKEPNIIMADEPTGALDSKTGEQVFETLKKLSKDKLVIVVSHDKDFAKRFGDRIIELKDGQVIKDRTKHMVEATALSDNVSIINENAIKINDAKKLTKADFEKLYDAIKKSEGNIFISSGENAEKSMKASRISEDGRSDIFKDTELQKLKEYDGKQTKFIRSKMPLGKSIKMGLSSLKTKPIRLAFTIFLSVVAFTMFGTASALMLYRPSYTISRALETSDYETETIEKQSNGTYISETYDESGNKVDGYSYKTTNNELFGVEEVKKLNQNNKGLVYIPVVSGNSYNSSGVCEFDKLTYENDRDFYNQYLSFYNVTDVSKDEFDRLGFAIQGNYPSGEKEIMISRAYGDLLIESGATVYTSSFDLIGKPFTFRTNNGDSFKATITGLFDAGDIKADYLKLKESNKEKVDSEQKGKLKESFPGYLRQSFNGLAVVSPSLFDKFDNDDGGRYVDSMYARGLYVSSSDLDYIDIDASYGNSFYTDEIFNKNKSAFKIYDLSGNEIDKGTFSLKNDEALIPQGEALSGGRRGLMSLFDTFQDIVASSQYVDAIFANKYVRYMPTLISDMSDSAAYSEARDIFERYRYDSYYFEEAIGFLEHYKDEFIKAYKISTYLGYFRDSSYFQALSAEEQNKITSLTNNSHDVTIEDVNWLYNYLYDNFDKPNACKNLILQEYIKLITDFMSPQEAYDRIITSQYLRDCYDNDSTLWSDDAVNEAITILDEEFAGGCITSNNIFNYYVNGYTFKDYSPCSEKLYEIEINSSLYYKNYESRTGKLTVVGYYEVERGNECYMLSKSFIDEYSSGYEEGNYRRTISYFKTDYVAPEDARYAYAMVKTSFSIEQIEQILKTNDKTFTYGFTSARYQNVSWVLSMINTIKQVFLWVGVAFGVFSGLMLLNFISVSIASKKKDIGILRAIGARKIDVFKIFFAEALFIGVLCALLGVIGTGITEFFIDRTFVEEIGISMLEFSMITVGLVFAITIVISFIATIIPVGHSSRKPPVESIRAL